MDLEPFTRINPCGYTGLEVTSMAELLPAVDLDEVGRRLLRTVLAQLEGFGGDSDSAPDRALL